MKISAQQEKGRLVIGLSGELDHHAARNAMREIEMRIDAGLPRECVIDMSGLSFTDSSGIAVVLKAYKRMCEINGRLTLENVRQQPMRVFEAAGLNRLVSVSAMS